MRSKHLLEDAYFYISYGQKRVGLSVFEEVLYVLSSHDLLVNSYYKHPVRVVPDWCSTPS